MKKLNSAALDIYKNTCRSQKKLGRGLYPWEVRFNDLLLDWLRDMDRAGIAINKEHVDTQGGIFLAQSQRELQRPDEKEESEIDLLSIIGALSESHIEWKTIGDHIKHTVRVKATAMIHCHGLGVRSRHFLINVLDGDYIEDHDTITVTVLSIERRSPITDQRQDELEELIDALIADTVRNNLFQTDIDLKKNEENEIRTFNNPSKIKRMLLKTKLMYF